MAVYNHVQYIQGLEQTAQEVHVAVYMHMGLHRRRVYINYVYIYYICDTKLRLRPYSIIEAFPQVIRVHVYTKQQIKVSCLGWFLNAQHM